MKHSLAFHDGKFKVLVFSDSQDFVPYLDPRTVKLLEKLLDDEKPDLVLMNGDVSDGSADTDANFREYVRQLTKPMEDRGIYWCHTYGNHDEQYIKDPALNKEYQQTVYESFPHCLSERGPKDIPGIGNYVLPILSSDHSKVAYAIWALDSLEYIEQHAPFCGENAEKHEYTHNPMGTTNYDYIKFEQIEWYYHRSQQMEKENGGKVPGLMFFHMALPEHRLVVADPEETNMIGNYNEEICNSPVNSGMFAAILQRGDVRGVYVGHDHVNDFVGTVSGIELGFDGSLGYGTYGLSSPDNNEEVRNSLRGARVFVIDEEGERKHKTYMRYGTEYGIK